MNGHKYRIMVDGNPIKDVSFLTELKPHQLDRYAREFADEHTIGWTGVRFIKVLNGVKNGA